MKNKPIQRWILLVLPTITLILGWVNVVTSAQRMEKNTIAAYQQAQSEVTETIAGVIELYMQEQANNRMAEGDAITEDDINAIEQNTFEYTQSLFSGFGSTESGKISDEWFYATDHIVVGQNNIEDFPQEYIGANMVEVFEIHGFGSHYEDMANKVVTGQAGEDWFIWDPLKGEELASWWEMFDKDTGIEYTAWHPLTVNFGELGDRQWVVGVSTLLVNLKHVSGIYKAVETSIIQMGFVSLLVVGLMVYGVYGQIQVKQLKEEVVTLKIEIDQAKLKNDVSEVVDTEHFQNLLSQVSKIREAKNRND